MWYEVSTERKCFSRLSGNCNSAKQKITKKLSETELK